MNNKKEVFIVRPGFVTYKDLTMHSNQSRENFFNEAGIKELRYYGLIHETDEFVKVMNCDDLTDDSEGEGIVIPTSCVLDIVYFDDKLSPIVDSNGDIN